MCCFYMSSREGEWTFFGGPEGLVHKQLAILYVRRDDFAVHKQ